MPDWSHSIIYILIMAICVTSLVYFTESLLGIVAGILLGHVLGSAVVTRLPGFWDP